MDRQHAARRQLLHEPGSLCYQPQRIIEFEYPSEGGGYVLSQAVTHNRCWRYSPVLPQLGKGVVHNKHGRLGELRILELLRSILVLLITRIQQLANIQYEL